MRRPPHGRRAKQAQWLDDIAMLDLHMGVVGAEYHAALILRRASVARRERRLARRRADRRAYDADALMLHAEDVRRRAS